MSPIGRGVLLAMIAAVAFGVTTPAVAWAGRILDPSDVDGDGRVEISAR